MSFPRALSSTLLPPLPCVKPRREISNPRSIRAAATLRSPLETRAALVAALAVQTSLVAQRAMAELAAEVGRYASPRRFEGRSIEEALMSVPDLETVKFKLLKKAKDYEIRQVESYFIAETEMPGRTGFDFFGASQAFNILATYLFGKNTKNEAMEMTTPVYTRRTESDGEKMDMTTPVITKRSDDRNNWKMSFVMPSKYGRNLPVPVDTSVKIQEVPSKLVAAIAFSGFVTDDEVRHKEYRLREALKSDPDYQVKDSASVEVAQFNPPFTPPFTRRNEISLEVQRKNV